MTSSDRTARFSMPGALLAVLALSAGAGAQQPIAVVHGASAGDQLGRSVAAAFDVDGDGMDDVIAGAWNDSTVALFAGAAHVLSGSGSPLHTFHGESAFDLFGAAVAGVGDVDHDGFADVAVGAPQDDAGAADNGSVFVFSGKDGHALYVFSGDGASDQYGASVAAAGDVDNDGFVDVVAGAIGDDDTASNAGMVRVRSGADGSSLRTWYGGAQDDAFGAAVAGGGDVDGDGRDDVVVGAPLSDQNGPDCGEVDVFSGASGALLRQSFGAFAADFLGTSVAGGLDLDGDAAADFAAGVPGADQAALNAGAATLYRGSDGGVVATAQGISTYDRFGYSLAAFGDLDGDQRDDLVIGARFADLPAFDSGSVRVVSGQTGATLASFGGQAALDEFGYSVAGAGDVNGDDVPDFVVGAWLEDGVGGADAGSARIFTGACGGVTVYGTGCPGSGGLTPSLSADGCPVAGGPLPLHVENGLGGSFGFFWVGASVSSIPLDGTCRLQSGLPIVVTLGPFPLVGSGPGNGEWHPSPIVPAPLPAGLYAHLQAALVDPGGPAGYTVSNAIRIEFP